MSDVPKWADICEQERAIAFDAATACHPLSLAPTSPIDNFYQYIASVIPLGPEAALNSTDALGRTLLLGIVSGTEHYFRSILAGLVRVCPVARRHASVQPIPFGSLEYYSRDELGLALLENISLATSGEIRTQTKRLIGIDIKQDQSLDAAFELYGKLCQLRHAAVHARGELGQQNLLDLGVSNSGARLAVRVDLVTFHSAAAISQNVVRGYNRLLFRKTVERWIATRLFSGHWATDRERFTQLHALFYSRVDGHGYRSAYVTHRSLIPVVRRSLAAHAGV